MSDKSALLFTALGFYEGPVAYRTRSKMKCEQDLKSVVLPSSWISWIGQTKHVKVELAANSDEFRQVAKQIPGLPYKIIKIERVENVRLFLNYQRQKAIVETTYTARPPLEQMLFHGTPSYNVDSICENGFEKKRIGQSSGNLGYYGSGVYFSPHFSQSHWYSRGDHTVLYCNVLVGESVVGTRFMPELPFKPHSKVIRYESAVDRLESPNEVVVFEECNAYPAYVLHVSVDSTFRRF